MTKSGKINKIACGAHRTWSSSSEDMEQVWGCAESEMGYDGIWSVMGLGVT